MVAFIVFHVDLLGLMDLKLPVCVCNWNILCAAIACVWASTAVIEISALVNEETVDWRIISLCLDVQVSFSLQNEWRLYSERE